MKFAFNSIPSIHKSRSRFDLSHSVKTMFSQGKLIPFDIQEIYPGDTFKIEETIVIRTSTPFIRPLMDNLFVDTFYFFVPNRLVYDKWVNVMGENTDTYWANDEEFSVPVIGGNVVSGSIADYLGLPLGTLAENEEEKISVLPFRGYALIYNEWFRDQNLQTPVYINKTGEVIEELNGGAWAPDNIFGMPANINKVHDYFTSCLPEPQKGEAVDIPVISGDIPVITRAMNFPSSKLNLDEGLRFAVNGGAYPIDNVALGLRGDAIGSMITLQNVQNGGVDYENVVPVNLGISIDDVNTLNVNDLRFAFQFQKMLERDSRSGTRYIEFLNSHFGVISPDARLQRPEFLGGKRIPLNIQQTTQTSASTENSPLGQVSAFSLTSGKVDMSKGFVEHGFIIGVMAVRQFHTYQQGIERFWSRRNRVDFYDPVFANIGEQPVYVRELYKDNAVGDVFGYNEAWADLRYRPNRITGLLRSTAEQGFDIWHLADYYGSSPYLGDEFIKENDLNINRVLSAPSSTIPNFIADIYVKSIASRVLPTYSIPGLIDHN